MIKRKIGLVIGTNNYAYPGIKNLEFAEADARAIKDVLLDANLCEFDEVIEVIGGSHTEASEKIEKMLNDAEPDDFILLYFSGHGKLDMKGKLRLLFKNTKLDYLRSTSLQFDFIKQGIEESRCKKIVIIIDSCFSGAAHIRGDELEKSLESSGEGTIVLSASKEFEVSKEDEALKHGVFTYYLWDGLKTGDADTDRNGLISIDELYNYAYKKIKEGYPQTPTKSGEFEGEIFIGKNPKKIKENIFKERRNKLAKMYGDGLLHEDLFYEAIDILSKDYEKPLTLTDIEKKIKPHTERLLDGRIALDDRIAIQRYSKTIEALKALHKPEPFKKKIDELNIIAHQLYNEGKYREAIDKWKEVLRLDLENQTAKDGIRKALNKKLIELSADAQRLFGEGMYVEAIAKWQEVLKLDSENRKAIEGIEESKRISRKLQEEKRKIDELNTSAQQLYDEGKYCEALDTWKEVLNLDSENQTAKEGIKKAEEEEKKKQISELSLQAQKLFKEKKYTEAIAKWQEVLNLDPYNRKAIEGKKEAERVLEELKQLYDEGTRAAKAKEWKVAIAAFRELVTLDSQYRDAAARLEEAEEKIQVEEEISELSSQAQKLFEEKKYTEAIAKWQEVLKLDSENREAIDGIEEAERILKKLKQLYDEGTRAAKAQEWKAAIATFRELVTLDSQYRDAAARLGEAEEKLKGIERKVKKYCPECRYPNEHGLKYCTKCGAKLFEGIEETEQNLKILQEKKKKIDKLNISAQQLYNEGKYSEAIDEWWIVLDQDLENQTAKEGIKKAEEKLKRKEWGGKEEKIGVEVKIQVKKYCPNCGYPNTHRLKHCTRCGANLELNT